MNMKSSLSLVMLASLCLFGCGKEGKEKKVKKEKKTEVVAEARPNESIPLFHVEDAQEQLAFAEEQPYDDYAYNELMNTEEDLLAWNDDQLLQEAAEQAEFKTVLFDFNGKLPSKDQAALLQEDIALAHAAIEEGKSIKVHGHCCQMGAAAYNLALSEKRAQAVKDTMVKNGIPEEKISVVGFGQEVPLVWTDAQTREEKIKDLALNRRAEIFAYSEDEQE